jgi:hypothetical protein
MRPVRGIVQRSSESMGAIAAALAKAQAKLTALGAIVRGASRSIDRNQLSMPHR